ncbi:MAG TPA: hypothetical protein VK627_00845 [Edaphobacter sp.]|jgi:hypothetical protein|nr:hypothetical protein [Edaphobacter sp.]
MKLSRRVVVLTVALAMVGRAGLVGWGQAVDGHGAGQSGAAVATEKADGKAGDGKAGDRPLPDIPTLMHEVEAHQKASEAIQKDYLFRSVETQQELDGHGGVKKTAVKEYDVFWMNGVPVHRLMKKDGRELSADEQKKESERIDKEAAKAKARRAKAEEQGKETDPRGHEEITVSRFLELGSFTNARRVQSNGRDTIAVDFTGDPKAKTRSRVEDVIRDLAGTVWVDEEDRVLSKVEGRFLNSFKIGVGLVANIQKGTSFGMEQRKVNGEVWLPAMEEGRGAARFLLLFSFNGSVRAVQSDYRKFKATSTILPGMSTVEENDAVPQ